MEHGGSTAWPEVSTTETHIDTESVLCFWYSIFIRDIFGGFLVVFGLIGNGLTMVLMGRERHKSSTMRMLFYLAIVDSLILLINGILAIPIPLMKLNGLLVEAYNLQLFSITILTYVAQTLNQISILFTVIVTWQRYVSVCIPLKAKKYTSAKVTNAMAVASVIFAILFYLPNFFHFNFTIDNIGRLQHHAVPFSVNKIYQLIYAISLFYLLTYICPIITLIFIGSSLLRSLRDPLKKKAAHKAKEEMTLSLVIVIIVFVICQSMGPLRQILMWVYTPFRQALQCGYPLFAFGPIFLVSFLLNSSVNFVIYVLCARGFRRKVLKLFGRRSNKVNQSHPLGTTSLTTGRLETNAKY